MRVRWTSRAAEQLRAAVLHLESERAGAGDALLDGVDRALAVAAQHPRLFAAVPGEGSLAARRALLRRWGYWLIFELREGDAELLVLSLWHVRRVSDGWRG